MVIDQLNTLPEGGAGVAALRLHRTLRQQGIDSRLWCARVCADCHDEEVRALLSDSSSGSVMDRAMRMASRIGRRFRWQLDKWRYLTFRSRKFEMFSAARLTRNTPFDPEWLSGDVLHLHWVTRFLDLPSFFSTVPKSHPVVWTVHDMNAFTGGCHHADGCTKFSETCGNCPQLTLRGNHDLSRRNFLAKQSAVGDKNLHVVTPSRWMENLVRQSRIFAQAKSVQTIYNGLDVQQFQPCDKQRAKRELGLPNDRIVLAFGAASLANRRKGWHEYVAAVNQLAGKYRMVGLVFGGGEIPAGVQPQFPVVRTGYLDRAAQQAMVYSAADLFVLSSLGENLAQTGVESLACGTPVVAFDVGGLSEYIRPHETGQLARIGDIRHLSEQIEWMIEHSDARIQMGVNGRTLVERNFDHLQQAKKYLALYQRITSSTESVRAA